MLAMDEIRKTTGERRAAVLDDYETVRARFDWAQARRALDGLPGGGLNIAHEAVVRHARGPDGGAARFAGGVSTAAARTSPMPSWIAAARASPTP